MPKMHENPIKARFIIASPKSSIKPLASTIASIFHFFLDKYKDMMVSVGLSLVLTPVIDVMNGLINEGKKLLSQPLTFLPCILNCHIINF